VKFILRNVTLEFVILVTLKPYVKPFYLSINHLEVCTLNCTCPAVFIMLYPMSQSAYQYYSRFLGLIRLKINKKKQDIIIILLPMQLQIAVESMNHEARHKM